MGSPSSQPPVRPSFFVQRVGEQGEGSGGLTTFGLLLTAFSRALQGGTRSGIGNRESGIVIADPPTRRPADPPSSTVFHRPPPSFTSATVCYRLLPSARPQAAEWYALHSSGYPGLRSESYLQPCQSNRIPRTGRIADRFEVLRARSWLSSIWRGTVGESSATGIGWPGWRST